MSNLPKRYETTNAQGGKGVVLSWASQIEDNTLEQAQMTSRALPIAGHVALMPDAHLGRGATVGSVLKTVASIIPAAVGVDIGCGMIAVHTDLKRRDVTPEALKRTYALIRDGIPSGVGKAHGVLTWQWERFFSSFGAPDRVRNDPALYRRASTQFGTLGDGNHFVELSEDRDGDVWTVLHSGSRGVGNVLSVESTGAARNQCASDGYELEDQDLAWLVTGTSAFKEYIEHMQWAQSYAYWQREAMMDVVLEALTREHTFGVVETINCHHNYAEQMGDSDVWLTRKGAIDASSGVQGIIPGSMGDATYIVQGLGNPLSYNSAPHGAGRMLARGAARRTLDVSAFTRSMEGILWQDRDAKALLDESPEAYKGISSVMRDSETLVDVVAVLKQFANYKGTARPNRR